MSNSSNMLRDNWDRPINYLRVAVTDRCNLRCFYCMPESGIKYLPKKELLTYEELTRFISIASEAGISKIRITGGEPFLRKELVTFLQKINALPKIDSIHITTNGVLTHQYINQFNAMGIQSVNLSLDTLNEEKFKLITRRNEFKNVMKTLDELIVKKIPTKINMVVMDGKNTDDIIPMIELAKERSIDVRLIEEMPFNGEGSHYETLRWDHVRILDAIKQTYPGLIRLPSVAGATATTYEVPGFKGNIGIIPAYSRTFCGSCNRIRLTAQGELLTCLYADTGLDIRQLLRSDATDNVIHDALVHTINRKAKDGHEAERNRKLNPEVSASMSTIGG